MSGDPGIFIGLGSNLGDRTGNLVRGLEMLRSPRISLEAVSAVYETEPWDCGPQPDYLNAAARLSSDLSCHELMEEMSRVERAAGRVRARPGQPRPLDLDLLFFGTEILKTPGLTIPHPRLHLRLFVLTPLAEIAPGFRHPVLHKTVAQLLHECPDHSRVEKVARLW